MAFPIYTTPKDLVPNQGNVDPRAMLPLAREQQHHDVRQHAGLRHVHYDEDMNLEDMLPLGQAFNLDQDDAMLEDDHNQLREQVMSTREHGLKQQVNAVQDRQQAFAQDRPKWSQNSRDRNRGNTMMEECFPPTEKYSPTGHSTISATTSIGNDPRDSKGCNAPTCPRGP